MSNKPSNQLATLNPEWDQIRETIGQLKQVGRLYLRGQVRLGLQLAAMKKDYGIKHGGNRKAGPDQVAESATWSEIVAREAGISRRTADVYIDLHEAAVTKLKKSKTLNLPAAAKKDALVLLSPDSALSLTPEQWERVDEIISSLTDGQTQASLMQELGLVPKATMPEGKPKGGKSDDPTAGELAFHFFEGVLSPMVNARTSPDYRAMLASLPLTSTDEIPISLSQLEAEAKALLADIEEVKTTEKTTTTGPTIDVPSELIFEHGTASIPQTGAPIAEFTPSPDVAVLAVAELAPEAIAEIFTSPDEDPPQTDDEEIDPFAQS